MSHYVGKVRFNDGQEKFVLVNGTSGYVYPALFDVAAEVAGLSRSEAMAKSGALVALKLDGEQPVQVWTDIELSRSESCFESTASDDRRILTGFLSKEHWADDWKRRQEALDGSPYDAISRN